MAEETNTLLKLTAKPLPHMGPHLTPGDLRVQDTVSGRDFDFDMLELHVKNMEEFVTARLTVQLLTGGIDITGTAQIMLPGSEYEYNRPVRLHDKNDDNPEVACYLELTDLETERCIPFHEIHFAHGHGNWPTFRVLMADLSEVEQPGNTLLPAHLH